MQAWACGAQSTVAGCKFLPVGRGWNEVLTPHWLLRTAINIYLHFPLFQNCLPSADRESVFIFLGSLASRSLPTINSLSGSVTQGISCSYSPQC